MNMHVHVCKCMYAHIHPSSEIDYLVSLLEKLAWPEEVQRNTGTTSISFFRSWTWPKEVHETLDTTSIAFFGGWTCPEEVHKVIRCHYDEQRRFARCCYDEPPRSGHYLYCVFWQRDMVRGGTSKYWTLPLLRLSAAGRPEGDYLSDRRPGDYCSTKVYIHVRIINKVFSYPGAHHEC